MSVELWKEKFKLKYLNPNGADIWFVFGDEKIPAHKFILETMSPWLNTMFNGSLPVRDEVKMNESGITLEAFKEFLRFIYTYEVKFTMDNVGEIIHLAKLSLTEEFFVKCEDFLIKSFRTEHVFFCYELALLYGANRLKKLCEKEISLNARQVIHTSKFLDFPYEFLENLLKCDALTCGEKDIFDACIAWARAACKRNNFNPDVPENIRAQLKESMYQIRFSSMTKEERSACISSCRGLFTIEELEEIICMVGNEKIFRTKKFNWTARNHKCELVCSRFQPSNRDTSASSSHVKYNFKQVERTTLKSNTKLKLMGFICEGSEFTHTEWHERERNLIAPMQTYPVNVSIFETDRSIFNGRATLDFSEKREFVNYDSNKATYTLSLPLLLRANCRHTIEIQFERQPRLHNYCELKSQVHVDDDISIEFEGTRGAISCLHLQRIDEKGTFKKRLWWILVALVVIMTIRALASR